MGTSNLKAPSITNLDASPIVANVIGEANQGFVRIVNDYVTTVSADDTSSTYRLIRIPTNAKIKKVVLTSAAASAGAIDLNIAYSDSFNDGTQQALARLANPVVIIPSANNKLFGAAQSIVGVAQADWTFLGTFTKPMQNIPLWQVLISLGTTQFTADPGGFFDFYAAVTTTITTGGILSLECWYVV